jgi:hypothetical protein
LCFAKSKACNAGLSSYITCSGADMGSKIELSPPRLMTDTKQDLANTIVDIVALPGGYHGGNGRK